MSAPASASLVTRKLCFVPSTVVPAYEDRVSSGTGLEAFGKAFQDPYYLKYIEPDEHNLIDKNSFAGGIIATFSSPFFQVMNEGKSQFSQCKSFWSQRL